jgi:hypothetical protein
MQQRGHQLPHVPRQGLPRGGGRAVVPPRCPHQVPTVILLLRGADGPLGALIKDDGVRLKRVACLHVCVHALWLSTTSTVPWISSQYAQVYRTTAGRVAVQDGPPPPPRFSENRVSLYRRAYYCNQTHLEKCAQGTWGSRVARDDGPAVTRCHASHGRAGGCR